MMQDLSGVRRQVRDYWYVDGLPELFGGAAISLFSAVMLTALATGSGLLANAALMVLVLSVAVVAVVMRAMKRRVTYPRTGQVTERLSSRMTRLAGIVVWVCVAIPVLAAWEHGPVFRAPMLILSTGVATGLAMAWAAYRRSQRAGYVAATACVAASAVAATIGVAPTLGIIVVFLTAGVGSMVVGAFTLGYYLARNPLPQRQAA
jgi:hypothetical protein